MQKLIDSFEAYLKGYFPDRYEKWIHLILHHPDLINRPCGCEKKPDGHQ